MILKRDWLLQQLGITQWELRRSPILQSKSMDISLCPAIRLLIVSEELPDSCDQLFCDILSSMWLTPEETYGLMPGQVVMLPKNTNCNSWRLGVDQPLTIAGVQLYTPRLIELSQDPSAKRALWEQIYTHEQYLYHHDNRFRHLCNFRKI